MSSIVPATAALFREYFNDMPMPTLQGWFLLDEQDHPIAIVGLLRVTQGRRVLFSEARDGVREKHQMSAVKLGKMVTKLADKNGWVLVADAAKEVNRSAEFLLHLGFELDEDTGIYTRCSNFSR